MLPAHIVIVMAHVPVLHLARVSPLSSVRCKYRRICFTEVLLIRRTSHNLQD